MRGRGLPEEQVWPRLQPSSPDLACELPVAMAGCRQGGPSRGDGARPQDNLTAEGHQRLCAASALPPQEPAHRGPQVTRCLLRTPIVTIS